MNNKNHLYLLCLIASILISACHSNRVYKEDFADNPAMWREFIIKYRNYIEDVSLPGHWDNRVPSDYMIIEAETDRLFTGYFGGNIGRDGEGHLFATDNFALLSIENADFNIDDINKIVTEFKKEQHDKMWAEKKIFLNSISEFLSNHNNEIMLSKTQATELLPDVKLIELKTTLPTNWNGRFVVVPMDYFSAGTIITFAQVLARAKRLGFEFLDETDKNVVKQFAEFRDKNSPTDKNDYWLGMKPEIMDKKLAMNLVNDQQIEMRCSKLDNSYLSHNSTFENFIFKVPKDLDAKILAERLRTKAWQNKTNDNEFASWFEEPKESPPPVEHRQSSRSSEYDGLEDWEIAEIKEAKKNKEIRQGINNAVSPVSSDLQSVKIKSPFAEDEKPTHYRRVDSTLCNTPKK